MRDDQGPGSTLQSPLVQPQWPAPQSIGPWHTFVQSSVHIPLKASFMQFVGWQHWAGTHSLLIEQVVVFGSVVVVEDSVEVAVAVVVIFPPGGMETYHAIQVETTARTINNIVRILLPDMKGNCISSRYIFPQFFDLGERIFHRRLMVGHSREDRLKPDVSTPNYRCPT